MYTGITMYRAATIAGPVKPASGLNGGCNTVRQKIGLNALRLFKTPGTNPNFVSWADCTPIQKVALCGLHPEGFTRISTPPGVRRLKLPRVAPEQRFFSTMMFSDGFIGG
jgi:hypothetical protein